MVRPRAFAVVRLAMTPKQCFNTAGSNLRDDPELRKMRSDCIGYRRLLANEKVPSAMQHSQHCCSAL